MLKQIESITKVHLIGICGTAMGSIAILFKEAGYEVRGSDQYVYPPMSTLLAKNNIVIYEGYNVDNLSWKPDLVIIGNAVTRGNPELEYTINHRWNYTSGAGALQDFFIRGKQSVVVTGTHGKTTTTSMMVHMLNTAQLNPGYLVGGVVQGSDSSARYNLESDFFVVEGDEYDTAYFDKHPKFHHYMPKYLIINPLEFDHADIYENLEEILSEFRRLVRQTPENGWIVTCGDNENAVQVAKNNHTPVETFGLTQQNDWQAIDFALTEHGSDFAVIHKGKHFADFSLNMPGDYNISNALSVIAIANAIGIDIKTIEKAISSFQGVKRRLEVIYQDSNKVIIDDFAHHPTAIEKTIKAAKQRYPKHKLWAIFEPRSWSMRKAVFQDRLPQSFKEADVIVLADVFASDKVDQENRLNPSKVIQDLHKLHKQAAFIKGVDNIVEYTAKHFTYPSVVLIMSNGGFDNIHQKMVDRLASKQPIH